MSAESLWTIGWPVFGLFAAEAALLVTVATLIARFVTAAVWRRTVWQGCILALLGLLVLEFSGSARYIAAFAAGKSRAAHRPLEAHPAVVEIQNDTVSAPLQTSAKQSFPPNIRLDRSLRPEVSAGIPTAAREDARPTTPTPSETSADTRLPALSSPAPSPSSGASPRGVGTDPVSPREPGRADLPVGLDARQLVPTGIMTAWLVLSWLCGALVFLAINAMARLSFARLFHRGRAVTDPDLLKRVEELAGRMGLRRPIRLFESARLIGPVAAGVLRPAIGLPSRFVSEHTPQQQDVMLAHEVAHLAANDPLWSRLADVLAALIWWHPLAWWARRQLRAASEIAADESSLLLRDGPRVLAECLVALGGRITRRQPVGGMGVEGSGFRSALGRRVERLVHLPARAWAPPGRVRCALARTVLPAALVAAVIFCTAWAVPQPSNHGDRMKTPARTLSLYALLAALYAPEPTVVAADALKPAAPKPATAEPLAPPPVPQPTPVTPLVAADATKSAASKPATADPLPPPPVPTPYPVARTDGAVRLKTKLDSIVLDQVSYDAIPLGQVVEFLMKEVAAKDPENVGVNFLFGQPAEPLRPAPAIDPATGLPVAGAPAETVELTSIVIRIVPPLKKIRLTDALDAIKRVADWPITYTVEGYAVVFSLDVPRIHRAAGVAPSQPTPPPALVVQAFTRSFKLDTNTFFASVQKLFRRQIDPGSDRVGEILQTDVFPRFGVKWNASDNTLFYNPLTGVVLVRASQEDLDIILAAVETLGGVATDKAAADPALARGGGGALPSPLKQ